MHIFGQYDFNRAPMAPPGTRIIAHETPSRRRTWAPHDKMDVILAQPWNITYVIHFTSPKPEETELWKQLIFFPENSPCHFHHLTIWPLRPQRI
jgi:hypothetical protein